MMDPDEALKREGTFRGNAEQLEERIASEFGITLAALQNAKKNPNRIKKLAPVVPREVV